MVPKILSSDHTTSTEMDDEELGETSDVEHSSSGDSNNESICSDDGDNDFSVAVNDRHTAGKKRKLEQNASEEDLDEDTEMEVSTEEKAPLKKKKKKKKVTAADLKPPTAEEMIRLRETENLFHSNLFRMQIEEMIKEVRPKKVERKQIKPWLESLKELFLNMVDSEELELSANVLPDGIKSPLPPRLPKETKWSSCFQKPTSVSVVGSYIADCCLGPALSVDVVVVIPKKCLLKEDYLNVRYHRKRVAYLSHLAAVLRDSQLIDKEQGVRWVESSGGRLSPRLLFNPAGRLSTVKVFLSAVSQQNCFKLSRFTPDKNNIRESWLTAGLEKDSRTPTPLYNTSVMRDLVMMPNEAIRQQTLENNNNLKDAVALLRVWLRQRDLDLGQGGFSGYLVSMLVVALSLQRRLNPLMSSYQVVRNVWLFLSQSDWTKEGFTMCSTKQEENTPSVQDFHRYFDVVFVDSTGHCNLAADIHRLTYLRVKQEAQLAVQCLDNPDMNSFHALFMTPMPFLRQYDHVVCLNRYRSSITEVLDKESTREERINHFVSRDVLYADIVFRLLQKGVGGRLEQLVYQLPSRQEWSVAQAPPKLQQRLIIGLILNQETALSIVEKGPPANEPQAAEFRALWGDRCELRRFRDGTVCEAVVWAEPSAPLASRRLITRQMVLSLLQERLGIAESSVTYLADQLEPLLENKTVVPEGFEYGTGEEACNSVIQSYDRLAKQLRELPDMPLDVSSVQGVSAVFRGADVFPPLARTGKPQAKRGMQGPTCWLLTSNLGKAPEYIAPIEVVMQLGLSRKWPEDLEAIRRIKAAFNINVAKGLKEKFDLQTQAYPEHVDVFKDGFLFRINIAYEREAVLLKESTLPDGKVCYRETQESLELEKTTIHLPQLTGALHGVQQQWPALSVACRLAKRWLCAQLLDLAHMPEVATELLIASLFLSPEPFRPLTQPQPMFLRFLHLLAHHNWHLEPVIINFNNDLKREDIVEIESHFRAERASLPPIFIATQYDRTNSVWTKNAPLLPVVVRLANLAKQSLTILENNLLSSALLEECKITFRPPTELYDALIHLKPFQLPRLHCGVDFTFHGEPHQLKVPRERKQIPITGFDPAQCYLQELRENYGDFALFFHDTYGGKSIGVLFKPSVFEQYDFKVSHVNCRKPIEEGKKTVMTFNFDAIIEDFYNLGVGLVKTIDLSPKLQKNIS